MSGGVDSFPHPFRRRHENKRLCEGRWDLLTRWVFMWRRLTSSGFSSASLNFKDTFQDLQLKSVLTFLGRRHVRTAKGPRLPGGSPSLLWPSLDVWSWGWRASPCRLETPGAHLAGWTSEACRWGVQGPNRNVACCFNCEWLIYSHLMHRSVLSVKSSHVKTTNIYLCLIYIRYPWLQ